MPRSSICSMDVVNTDHLDAPVEKVAALFCSEAFLVRAHSARDEVASASYEIIEETATHRSFAVLCQQYRRKKTGGIDKRNTDDTSIVYRFDADAHRAEWHFESPAGDKIRIRGTTTFEPSGTGTLVTETAEVHARLPLIGRFIERMIAKGIDGTFDGNRGLVRELLGI